MGLVAGQFSESYPPILDGVGNVVKNYAYWINKKYGTSYVITPKFPGHTDNEEYKVLRYISLGVPTRPPYRTGLPGLDPGFMKQLRAVQFDIIHAHTPFSTGNIALEIARKNKIPLVASFHSKYYDDFLESFKIKKVAQYGVSKVVEFYENADSVWTVNESTAQTLREYGYKGSIEVVPNGTEFLKADNKEIERKKVNDKLNLKDEDKVFIYVGQMVWQKNTRILLEALSKLKTKNFSFKMIMVGQGYALEDLKELSKNLNLDNDILFLGAVYDRDYLKSLYCRADLLLFPSLYDNSSIVLQEAASQCCPPLLIEGSNTAENVVDDYNGFLAKNDPESISERIIIAFKNPGHMTDVGINANKTIYRNWEAIVDEVYERYCHIIKTKISR
jgi:1,2-diacylglycerol 3-alpha-glucosyltransferase